MARALGWPSVAWGLARISSHELSEWMAFSELEPFGYEIDMLGHAITSATISNRLRGSEDKVNKVQDFMPILKYDEHEEEGQTVEEQINIVDIINVGAGGKDLRKHK